MTTKPKRKQVVKPYFSKLLKLARFLAKLPSKKFNFNTVVDVYNAKRECGSVCCAVGWCPSVFPKEVHWVVTDLWPDGTKSADVELMGKKYREQFFDYEGVASKLFAMRSADAYVLFTPGARLSWFTGNIRFATYYSQAESLTPTPQNVAASIRAYVKWKKTGKKTDPKKVIK